MNKQYEVLKWASLFLEEYKAEQGVAEILLQHHLDLSRSQFFMNMRDDLPVGIVHQFKTDVKRHVEIGIPVQHLIGYEYFYGRRFSVNKDVLIPRPETEEIVQHAINMMEEKFAGEPITIVDLGTGSGVIGITLALELPQAHVYATDISADALTVARENASDLGANITFLQGDFLQPIMEEKIMPTLIISNPPYIAESEEPSLSRTVKNFDPALALFAEEDGLAAYQTIIEQTAAYTQDLPMLLFEIGHEQGSAVRALVKNSFPNSEVDVIQDINEKDRIVSANINR